MRVSLPSPGRENPWARWPMSTATSRHWPSPGSVTHDVQSAFDVRVAISRDYFSRTPSLGLRTRPCAGEDHGKDKEQHNGRAEAARRTGSDRVHGLCGHGSIARPGGRVDDVAS